MGEKQPDTKERLLVFATLLGAFLLVSILAEFALRAAGIFETYGEANGIGYYSAYEMWGTRWFQKRSPGHHEKVVPEYTERFYVNEHGFRDRDWPLTKESDEIRVVTLGGSFVEGVGSTRQSWSYPSQLSNILESKFGHRAKILVMNGGVIGSDPVNNLQALKRIFYNYQPDLIVQAVDEGDWNVDIPIRGGLDRFNEDGTVSPGGPWFEPLFEHSHLFRAFILKMLRYKPGILISRSERNRRSNEAVVEICKVLEEQSRIAQKLDALLVVEMMFRRSEIVQGKIPSDRALSVKACAMRHASVVIDLGEEFLQRFSPEELDQLYWPIDLHFKPAGYKVWAQIVADATEPLVASRIESLIPSPSKADNLTP